MSSQRNPIIAYTDGAALGNPGPGGYGVILCSGSYKKEISRGFRRTTNNRMELLGVIAALEALKHVGSEVTIYSDSRYVVDAVEKGWLFKWEKKGFAKTKNADLWQRFLLVYARHKVNFRWVKGHAGHKDNERCDGLAFKAAKGAPRVLGVDAGYEVTTSLPTIPVHGRGILVTETPQ